MGRCTRSVAVILLLLASLASAKTKLDVKPGFDDRYRPGRWVPVTVTVQSDVPRSGVIELRVPNASSSVMTIRQQVGIGTEPQTYILYAPLALQTDPLKVTLFDAGTNKPLADWPGNDDNFNVRLGLTGEQVTFTVLTTGRTPVLQGYRRTGIQGVSLVDHLRPSRLPATAIGLDAADVLFINDPDWSQINIDQQRAMIAWVRSGGTLLLWPGVDPLPPELPLREILPATLSDPTTLEVGDTELKEAGLGKRFSTLTRRPLVSTTQATAVRLLGGGEKIVVGRVGLGQVAMLPIDAGILQFNSPSASTKFWDDIFSALLPTDKNTDTQAGYYGSPDIEASHAGLDRIGDIPNTGAFGFPYMVALIGGMMLLVGPIDYFVLKKIGHQPWTWGTTIGWIGLITIGAIYAGHLLRSGDLHFRTLRLIEQASDGVTGENALALVYAPKSSNYSITSGDGWWWQPVPAGNRFSSDSLSVPLDTYQSARGNAPERMWIEVWNWRFLQGKRNVSDGTRAAILKTELRDNQLSVTNQSQETVRLIGVASGPARVADTTTLTPGSSKVISLPPKVAAIPQDRPELSSTSGNDLQPFRELVDTQILFYLDLAASAATDRAMRRNAWVLYAEITDPDSDFTIDQPGAKTQHKAYLRALIESEAKS